jgi:tetratricopeptide (TPR) repeat protein
MTLTLEWLGVPTIRVDGRDVRLGAKAVSLLTLMSVEGGVRRRDAGRWLWPGANDALNSVSSARVSLGKVIGAAHLGGDTERLWLEGDWWCDVNAFRAALGSGEVGVLETAWASWRGAFLDGLRLGDWQHGLGEEFENWVYTQREQLERERADLAFSLARFALERDETARAAAYLEVMQGDHGEIREDASRVLMLVHGALGRRDEATQGYTRLERRLHAELNVSPTPQTRMALEAARSGTEASRSALRTWLRPSSVADDDANLDAPFVGRQTELNALLEVLHRRRDEAQVALIAGEPGAGKTRLMREALKRCTEGLPRVTIVSTACSPTSLPFAAAIRLAQQLAYALPDRLERLQAVWRELLLRLEVMEPEIAESKRALFTAAMTLVSDGDDPVVLALDDLQWADLATVEFLTSLLQAPRLTIVATLRDTEIPRADLRGLLELIARAGRGTRLNLSGLSSADLAALAGRLGRDDVDASLLHRSSGGNPFYALELLRGAHSVGRVHEVVRLRLEALDGVAHQTLEALAVLGDGASQASIRAVAGRSLEETGAALDALSRAGLIRFEGSGARFAHDLTREVTLEELGVVRRELLHLRAARALPLNAASATHYWVSRGAWEPDEDTPRATAALLEALGVYARRGDSNAAQIWFERALEIAPDAAGRIRALIERSKQHERFGQHQQALEMLDGADELLEFEGDPLLLSDALITRAHLFALKLGQPDIAEPLVERALGLLAHGVPREASRLETLPELRSDALSVAGTIARLRGDPNRAVTYFRQALTLRRALRDPWRISSALNNLATALIQTRDPRAEAPLREAMRLSEDSGDVVGLARALNNLGVYCNDLAAQHDEASSVYERVLELQRGIGDEWGIASATLNLGVTAFYQGRFDEARSWYLQTLERCNAHDLVERRREALYNLVEVELQLGEINDAQTHFRALQSDAQMRDAEEVRELERALELRIGRGQSR